MAKQIESKLKLSRSKGKTEVMKLTTSMRKTFMAQVKENFVVDTPDGKVQGLEGDYLVRDEVGKYWVYAKVTVKPVEG